MVLAAESAPGRLRLLVLGGTDEARRLAAALAGRDGIHLVSSLAGRVHNPKLPVGEVHEGGFGGPEGLAAWLAERRIDVVVDATHPFAATISAHAAAATGRAGVPLLRLARPGWRDHPDADRWRWVADVDAAYAEAQRRGYEVLHPLTDEPWGVRRFFVRDPDGNVLNIVGHPG